MLTEWRPFAVEITLYGRTRETYERLTGVPGSFDRCMRGIRLLIERGLPLRLKTVAVTINRHEVPEMQQFAEELGVEFKFDGMINARIDCSHSPLDVRLTPAEMVELDVLDPARRAQWAELASRRAPGGRDPRQGLPVRRRDQLLRHRSRREDEHLRAVAQRPVRSAPGELQGGVGGLPRQGARQDDHPPDQVHRLPHPVALLRLRGHQRAGARRSGGAGGVLLRGGPPARARRRLHATGARRLRVL